MDRFKKRPLSWSQIASWQYNPEQWYKRYILNEKQTDTKEILFGKALADSIEAGNPKIPLTLYSKIEYPLKTVFNGINLVGFIDSYEPHTDLTEIKTGKREWTKDRAQRHGQFDMYLLQLFIQHKVKPEDINCLLQWCPTRDNGDFTVSFVKPIVIHKFEIKKTMNDILVFGAYINKTVEEMDKYIKNYPLANNHAVN